MQNGYHYDLIKKKQIEKELSSIPQIKLLDIYYYDDPLLSPYEAAIDEMTKLGYPVSMEFELSKKPIEILKEIYAYKNITAERFKWLIPYQDSRWWIEAEIYDAEGFFGHILKDRSFQITVADTEHDFIFDSTIGDNDKYQICFSNHIKQIS